MASRFKEDAPDAIDVLQRGSRVLECRARGFISRATQLAAYRAIDEILDRSPERQSLLWDSLAVDGFEPGLPIALTRFLTDRIHRFRSAAVVTRSPTIVAVSRAALLLVPRFSFAVFEERAEALAFIQSQRDDGNDQG